MAEIRVKINEIDNAIIQLKTIVTQMGASKNFPPSIVGGGQSVNELEAIAEVYKNIESHLIMLIQNTSSFLSNVESSFVLSDQKARNKMNSE